MPTFDGLSHGSWVTNWHLFSAVEKMIKTTGSVRERLPVYLQSCVFAPQPLSKRAFSPPPLGTPVPLD